MVTLEKLREEARHVFAGAKGNLTTKGEVLPIFICLKGEKMYLMPLAFGELSLANDEAKHKTLRLLRCYVAMLQPDMVFWAIETWVAGAATEAEAMGLRPRDRSDRKEAVFVLAQTPDHILALVAQFERGASATDITMGEPDELIGDSLKTQHDFYHTEDLTAAELLIAALSFKKIMMKGDN
jgi:hypothetical protein